ncbi:MAG TPA: sigma-70 factor domain-containing protein, partial [Rhodospirillales bacterium]|nr:sigma-70 factor domain-containing protein [Rhodospirillales bacterium]
MSSNARKIPADVLSHPAVEALLLQAAPTGSVTPEQVRQASEDAAVEPRHLKALLAHLSGLGISVALPAGSARVAAAASTRKTTTAATKKAPAKKAAAKTAAPVEEAPATTGAPAKKAPAAAKTAAKAPAKKAAAKKTAAKKTAEAVVEVDAAAVVIGPDGKKILPDIPDDQFEKDVKTDPTIVADEKSATFIVSAADDTDEPEQQVMVAGATADPVKDYLKQIGKVPLLNAEMEVELAKRIEAGLFSEEKLNKGGKITPKVLEELEWI